jgi:PAS domain S-box-containing protein
MPQKNTSSNRVKTTDTMDTSSHNYVNIILDSIADGVFTVDREWRIMSFNRAAERITGFSKEDAIGQYCYEIFRSNLCQHNCALYETIDTGRNIVNKEINILDRSNQEIPVSISTAVLRDEHGELIGGVETFRDLSLIKALDKEIHDKYSFQDIISKHPRILNIFRVLPDISQSDATVLIEGESGTGKELFAQAIHNLSPRKDGPLVKVNCGALPETLLESELFGYVRGAFTDAKTDKPGRFAVARGGTIFLDEIGDIPPGIQVKLLRVLENKEYSPLGSSQTLRADVRIVAATNRDLQTRVHDGLFREDLFYRLNVVRLELPTLQERRMDIPLLVNHFIATFNKRTGKDIQGVSEEAMSSLMNYSYPGNIRELQNSIEHAFILCKDKQIRPEHLPGYLHQTEVSPRDDATIQKMEHHHILKTLEDTGGNMTQAAHRLGIHRSTLWRKLRRMD